MLNEQEFIGIAVTNLLKDGFSLRLSSKARHGGYGGWFDANNKTFFTCFGGEHGFEIFVHEYCHYLQYKHSKIWNRSQISLDKFSGWLNGDVKLSSPTIKKHTEQVLKLEWDCEIKASKIFARNNFSISKEEYCRAANLYLMFYYFVRKFQKWPSKPIYSECPEILEFSLLKIMPFEFYLSPGKWPKEIKKHFNDRIFNT